MPRKIQPERAVRVLRATSHDGENYIFALKYHGIVINSMRFNARTNQVRWPRCRAIDRPGFPLIKPNMGITRSVQHAMWIYLANQMLKSFLPETLTLEDKVASVKERYSDVEYDSKRGFYFPHWSVIKAREKRQRFESDLREFHQQILDPESLAHRLKGWCKRDAMSDLESAHREFVRERCQFWRKYVGNEADFDEVYPRSKAMLDQLMGLKNSTTESESDSYPVLPPRPSAELQRSV